MPPQPPTPKKLMYGLNQCFSNFLLLQTIKHCKIVWRTKKYYKTNNADHKFEILLDKLTFL
jgi:hypothetical protein